MNWDAYYERENNRKHIQRHERQGHVVFEIDRRNVLFRGRPWLSLSDREKRKFETNIILEHGNERKRLKFLYV